MTYPFTTDTTNQPYKIPVEFMVDYATDLDCILLGNDVIYKMFNLVDMTLKIPGNPKIPLVNKEEKKV